MGSAAEFVEPFFQRHRLVVLFICRPVYKRDGLSARVPDEFFGSLELTGTGQFRPIALTEFIPFGSLNASYSCSFLGIPTSSDKPVAVLTLFTLVEFQHILLLDRLHA